MAGEDRREGLPGSSFQEKIERFEAETAARKKARQKQDVSGLAGTRFFAGRGRSLQPGGFEEALALARGLRRSARFAGFFFNPTEEELEREVRGAPRGERTTLITGRLRRTKLTPSGVVQPSARTVTVG